MDRPGNQVEFCSSTVTIALDDERRALVQRIASSRQFVKAHQLRDILLYLFERAVSEPSGAVHEQEIGRTVLGRKPDFNPHEDNIVRVQVSHLRKRLEEYFAAEGETEPLRIVIPRGAYALKFEPRPAPPSREPAPGAPARKSLPELAWSPRPFWAMIVFLGLTTVAASYEWKKISGGHEISSPAQNAASPAEDPLWSAMFSHQPLNIVVADSCLVVVQDVLNLDLSLADYLKLRSPDTLLADVPPGNLKQALTLIAGRQYTSLADLNSATKLIELGRQRNATTPAIRYARHMNVRDFKTGNFILVGSRRGIPWVRLFESQLNFSMEQDPASRAYYFRNRNPGIGEQTAYRQVTGPDASVESYADVALVPNLDGAGLVLILSGIGMEASEAAGEMVTSQDFHHVLSSILPRKNGQPQLSCFEILLRTRVLAGAARNTEVVTYRLLHHAAPEN